MSDHIGPIVVSSSGIGRSAEGKDLAGFGQRLLKSRGSSEGKATLLLAIALCFHQHKVISTAFHPENCMETLPAEWIISIHSGVARPGGGNHPTQQPHGTVGKSPWASGDWSSSASSTVHRSVV